MVWSLSVAEVAALLNVSILLVQATYPLLLSFIAVGVVTKGPNAATWSVFGRLINSSHWPLLLGTDAASDKKVLKRVQAMTWLTNAAAVLLAVSAAITPLGLHTTTRLGKPQDTAFTYVRDGSQIGRATGSRDGYGANRLCGHLDYPAVINCPGNFNGWNFTFPSNGSTLYDLEGKNPFISSALAQNITDVFAKRDTGTSPRDTIARALDIEYRTFVNLGDHKPSRSDGKLPWIDEGHTRSQGQFQYYQQFLLNDKIEAVEGLIISTLDPPGIGFRNHTLPPSSEHKYTWTEEILWLEPETICTDLNISLDYSLPPDYGTAGVFDKPDANLTDRGGLLDFAANVRGLNSRSTQADAKLLAKSWSGAVHTNSIIRGLFNVTEKSAHMEQQYDIKKIPSCDYLWPSPNQLSFSMYGQVNASSNDYRPNLPGELFDCTAALLFEAVDVSTYTPMLGIGDSRIYSSFLDSIVDGYSWDDPQTSTTIGSVSGLMESIAFPLDNNGELKRSSTRAFPVASSKWRRLYFSCASAIKASVKTVHFEMQGEADVSNLQIRSVQPSKASRPIWAIEDTGWSIEDIDPLWGLISESKEGHAGISAFDKSEIYLPVGASSLFVHDLFTKDAIAAAKLPLGALYSVYSPTWTIDAYDFASVPDYSGNTNWVMLQEWARLSQNASTAGRIIDLTWTDIMANAVVGSKSNLPNAEATSVTVPVAQYLPVVAYDWRYAALALCFAALYLCMLVASIFFYVAKRSNIGNLRFYLNQTAAGRSAITERYEATEEIDFARNKEWAGVRGDELILANRHDASGLKSDSEARKSLHPARSSLNMRSRHSSDD